LHVSGRSVLLLQLRAPWYGVLLPMMEGQIWSWILSVVGLTGFYLAGQKVWWSWYINIFNQALWLTYALVTDQYGFIAATLGYTFVFVKNAIKWTKERNQEKREKAVANFRDEYRENLEVVLLGPNTIDDLVTRTEHSREDLQAMMDEARANNQVRVFALFRVEKLS